MSEQSAEKEVLCGCHWEVDEIGRPAFRECSEHYVSRVTPSERSTDR